ncbi:MAG: hypothetical protein K0B10_07160 [Vicingaceae bacterium]|nr:hypothetical protein [Vicingaceae bacterium]
MITPNLIYEQSINDNTDPIYSNFNWKKTLKKAATGGVGAAFGLPPGATVKFGNLIKQQLQGGATPKQVEAAVAEHLAKEEIKQEQIKEEQQQQQQAFRAATEEPEKATFWQKHKTKVYAAVLIIAIILIYMFFIKKNKK